MHGSRRDSIMAILDGDDTCWYCRHNYFIADWACGQIMSRELGVDCPAPQSILDLAKNIEREAMRQHGYRTTQFEDAWVEVYYQYCQRYGLTRKQRIVDQIFYEAAYVKRADYPAIPEIYGVLNRLRPLAHSVNMISLGDHDFQMQKVRSNDLEHRFDSIHITAGDKGLVMKELAAEGHEAVMIGDSLHSDIEPAVALGLEAVWIKNHSPWTQSENPLDPKVHVINHIDELPALFERLYAR